MKTINRCLLLFIIALISSRSFAQQSKMPVNFLNTPASLSIGNTAYSLAWSAHPSSTYYKQEYLPKGESLDKFTNMMLLEVVTTGVSPKDAIAGKVSELKQMKSTNPYVSYDSSYNQEKSEYILDFILTANTADGKNISIAERNIYRYKKYTGKNGEAGVILLGVSKRSYGAAAKKFVTDYSVNKQELVNQVKQFSIPAINVTK